MDFDDYYRTRVSRPYAASRAGFLLGALLLFIGIVDIVITIVDMYTAQYNLGQTQTNSALVYTWDENPFWPTYGKGFWVGLLLVVTGIVGIVSSIENTITSIYAFGALSVASAIFSFYLLISASIPVSKLTNFGTANQIMNNLGNAFYNSLAYNAVLIATGGIGFILSLLTALATCILAGCCSEKRGYGGQLVEDAGIAPVAPFVDPLAVPY